MPHPTPQQKREILSYSRRSELVAEGNLSGKAMTVVEEAAKALRQDAAPRRPTLQRFSGQDSPSR